MHSSRQLDRLEFRVPQAGDADAVRRFFVAQQARTYADRLPRNFCEESLAERSIPKTAATLTAPDTRALIALDGERIVGGALAETAPADWERSLSLGAPIANRQLERLYVTPEWHGSGLGQRLLDAVLNDEAHYLWLIDGNERAARFYERNGFHHIDERVPTGAMWIGMHMHRMLRPSVG